MPASNRRQNSIKMGTWISTHFRVRDDEFEIPFPILFEFCRLVADIFHWFLFFIRYHWFGPCSRCWFYDSIRILPNDFFCSVWYSWRSSSSEIMKVLICCPMSLIRLHDIEFEIQFPDTIEFFLGWRLPLIFVFTIMSLKFNFPWWLNFDFGWSLTFFISFYFSFDIIDSAPVHGVDFMM